MKRAIRITSDLTIRYGNLHIAGQTAPSPGIMIRGAAIKITASDVVIQHLRVRTGDDLNGPDPTNRDSLKIEGTSTKPVKNIVIDHCSFSWAIDEIASTPPGRSTRCISCTARIGSATCSSVSRQITVPTLSSANDSS